MFRTQRGGPRHKQSDMEKSTASVAEIDSLHPTGRKTAIIAIVQLADKGIVEPAVAIGEPWGINRLHRGDIDVADSVSVVFPVTDFAFEIANDRLSKIDAGVFLAAAQTSGAEYIDLDQFVFDDVEAD